jgi:hypothetical protein
MNAENLAFAQITELIRQDHYVRERIQFGEIFTPRVADDDCTRESCRKCVSHILEASQQRYVRIAQRPRLNRSQTKHERCISFIEAPQERPCAVECQHLQAYPSAQNRCVRRRLFQQFKKQSHDRFLSSAEFRKRLNSDRIALRSVMIDRVRTAVRLIYTVHTLERAETIEPACSAT